MLGSNRTILQVMSRPEEYGAFRQMREDLLEMVIHPSLGLPTDEAPIGAMVANKAKVFPGNNPLQEYIDRACNIVWPLVPIVGREVGFSQWIL